MTGLSVKVITTIPCCRLQDFLPILWLEHIVHRSLDPRFPRPFFLTTARFFYGLPLKPSTETKASFMPYSNMPGYPVSPVCCSSILDNLAFSITPMLLCLRASVNTIPHPCFPLIPEKIFASPPGPALDLQMTQPSALQRAGTVQQGRRLTSGCVACGVCLAFSSRFCVFSEAPDKPGKVCGFISAQLTPCVTVLMPGFPDGQAETLELTV